MTFDTAAYSARGCRAVNEDAFAFHADGARDLGAWFMADGLGGHAHGDIASRVAADAAVSYIKHRLRAASAAGDPAGEDPAMGAAAAADLAIRECTRARPELSDMRTTFVAAVAQGGELHLVHLGDSRFYLLRGGEIEYRTRDHSLAELDVRLGEIGDDGIRGHPDRNIVLRMLPMQKRAWLRGQPVRFTLRAGDAFVLCTDGFWECLYEAEMREDLSGSAAAKEWLTRMTRRVAGRAPRDNHSAICCFCLGGV